MITVGQSVVRRDAQAKVTGSATYARDLSLPRMWHMKLLFAARPHARLLAVDTSRALAQPGVHAIFTARDVPHNRYGLLIPDQPVFCDEVVRFVGDRVAAVVAETPEQAAAAAALVEVRYEDLPVVADPAQALRPDAPCLHPEHPDNVLSTIRLRRGDTVAALAAADVVVERIYRTSAQEQAFLEPEAGLGYIDAQGRVTVQTAGQCAHDDQRQIAEALGLPLAQVRVIYGPIGGAFGGREDVSVQIVLALAALRLGHPVKIAWDRTESITGHVKRHPMTLHYKWGALSDGKIIAAEMDIVSDAGAYASTSSSVLENFLFCATGPYDIPHVRVDGRAVYTNNVPSGAMRGFGAPQATFASELQIAHLAEALGIDPLTLRLRNCLRDGTLLSTRSPVPGGVSLPELIEACARAAGATETEDGWCLPVLDASMNISDGSSLRGVQSTSRQSHAPVRDCFVDDSPHRALCRQPARNDSLAAISGSNGAKPKRRGWGLAVSMKNAGFSFGFPEGSTARVVLYGDTEIDRAEVHTAAPEVGQGTHSALAQLAAERLGIPLECVTVTAADTADIGDSGPASASRLTFFAGNAVVAAADLALARWRDEDRPAAAEYRYEAPRTTAPDPETGACRNSVSFSYAAQAVEVEVDTETGEVRVARVIAAQDPGRAVNPQQVQAQIEGSRGAGSRLGGDGKLHH